MLRLQKHEFPYSKWKTHTHTHEFPYSKWKTHVVLLGGWLPPPRCNGGAIGGERLDQEVTWSISPPVGIILPIYIYICIYIYINNGLEQPCMAPTCEADFLVAAGAARRAAEVIGLSHDRSADTRNVLANSSQELQNHTTTRSGTWSKPDFQIKYVNMIWATSIELHKGSTKRRLCHAANFKVADLQLAVNCLATVGARNSQLDLRFPGSSRFAYLELNKLWPGSKKLGAAH